MLQERLVTETAAVLRATLDRFRVGNRLQHIREFVWRGGELRFRAANEASTRALDACYVLVAQWPAPDFEHTRTRAASSLVSVGGTLMDGTWVRGTRRYELRVGIHMAAPSAMYVRSDAFWSHVPVVARRDADVEDRLQAELEAYVDQFLNRCASVPDAAARDHARLRQLGLADG